MAVFTGEVKGYFEIWVHKGNQEDKGGHGEYYVKSKPQGVFVCFVFGFFCSVLCPTTDCITVKSGTAQDSLFH